MVCTIPEGAVCRAPGRGNPCRIDERDAPPHTGDVGNIPALDDIRLDAKVHDIIVGKHLRLESEAAPDIVNLSDADTSAYF